MRRRTVIITCLAAVVVIAAVVVFVVIPALRPRPLDVTVDRAAYPVKGIDVSHHNGAIDFGRVRADSVDFVIIKASDGVGDYDARLSENYAGARRAGLDVGVYHYFRYHRSGADQARYFLSVVDTMAVDLPVAIDLEDTDNEEGHDEYISERLRDMVDILHGHGYRVMVYANHEQYESYIEGRFPDVDLWMASSRAPEADDPRRVWQHSHRGRVDGIAGDVDLNAFNGTRAAYRRWKNHRP